MRARRYLSQSPQSTQSKMFMSVFSYFVISVLSVRDVLFSGTGNALAKSAELAEIRLEIAIG